MSSTGFAYPNLFGNKVPPPAPRWAGNAKYNFIGGHNDRSLIPIEGLIEATASVLRRLGVNIIGAPLDDDGIRIDALAEILADLKRQGTTPKYICTVPTIQNPTGSIMPLERRRELLALARDYGVPIFEDECYADLT